MDIASTVLPKNIKVGAELYFCCWYEDEGRAVFDMWTYEICKVFRPKRKTIDVRMGSPLKQHEVVAIRRRGKALASIKSTNEFEVIRCPVSLLANRDLHTTRLKAVDSEITNLKIYIKDSKQEIKDLEIGSTEQLEEIETLDLMIRVLPKATQSRKRLSKSKNRKN